MTLLAKKNQGIVTDTGVAGGSIPSPLPPNYKLEL